MRHYIKYTLFFLIGFLLLFLVLNLKAFLAAKIIYTDSLGGKDDLTQAVSAVQQNNFKDAANYAVSADNKFSEAAGKIGDIKDNFIVKRLPVLEDQAQAVGYLITTADTLSRSLAKGATIVSNITDVVSGETTPDFSQFKAEDRQKILQMVYDSTPDLKEIKTSLDSALANLGKVQPVGFLAPFAAQITVAKDQLNVGAGLLSQATILSEILPALAGYPAPANYLVVLENSDELRPTGGFIGTLGVFKIDSADLTEANTYDSYHLDMPASLAKDFKVTPPVPIAKYLGVKYWYLRDSNWSPDWPTSAEKIKWFYEAEAKYNTDPQIKAVPKFTVIVAVTPRLITDLLYLVGPITVNGQEYTKDNFTDLLQYEVEVGYQQKGVSEWNRKKVIGAIFKALKDKLFTLPSSQYLELLQTLNQDVTRKNLLVYFTDPNVQAVAEDLGWGGEIKNVPGDYLMVVDANLAAFKTDRVMDKTYDYTVTQKADGLYAHLEISYVHNGQFDWKTTTYRTFVRVYAPLGSQLIKATGFKDGPFTTPEEKFSDPAAGKTVFGGFLTIDPGHSGTVDFDYKLPASLADSLAQGSYSLYLQKQPGNHLKAINIDAQFQKDFKNYAPAAVQANGTKELKWSGDINADNSFQVSF